MFKNNACKLRRHRLDNPAPFWLGLATSSTGGVFLVRVLRLKCALHLLYTNSVVPMSSVPRRRRSNVRCNYVGITAAFRYPKTAASRTCTRTVVFGIVLTSGVPHHEYIFVRLRAPLRVLASGASCCVNTQTVIQN